MGLNGVKIEKKNVQEVVNWPVLRSVKDVQKFLELTNCYKQFVKYFAKIAKSLHEITRKNVKWNWGVRQQKIFKELKERFTTKPDLNKRMKVEVDVSYCQ